MAKKRKTKAERSDRQALYQESVQNPDHEVELADTLFKRYFGKKKPLTLREDFCGTGLLCAEWVNSHPKRKAVGVDLDPAVLEWGRVHNIEPLGEDAARVTLLEQDVREKDGRRHDIVMAFNYSYFCFHDRATLRSYFETCREHLEDEGLFVCDLFGGWESVQTFEEVRKQKGFRYVWHQAAYNPIDHRIRCHIHFRFKDGSAIEKAFTYDWRLWTIPELRELLEEAGFAHTEVLWEGEDKKGQGNGVFKPKEVVENDPGFNAYLVASMSPPQKKAPRRKKGRK